jgi:hypothetical protein
LKRFTITGKKVFRDNQEGVFYVLLNDDTTMIQVENNPEDMAVLAWNQSGLGHKEEYIKKNFPQYQNVGVPLWVRTWSELPNDVQESVITYQKSKMEIKA